MHGKRYIKKINLKNIIANTILIICIMTMIITGIKIYKWQKENQKNNEIINEINKVIATDGDKYNIDFNSLKQKNPDTIGWLKVNGTNINHPVVQTTNNDYYLTHSFDKSNNSSGWVFMDYRNKLNNIDSNTIIYAHNRRDGSLFATLKNVLSENWQNNEENFIITLITENETNEYRVFSVYEIKREDYDIKTNFNNDEEYEEFLNKIILRSVKNFNQEITTNDKILTLSTCADNSKYRIVLHAKKIS